MTGRRTNVFVVALTAIAVLVAEFGQVGCHASCFAAVLGKVAKCPLGCCSQKSATTSTCCSVANHATNDRNHCPRCPVCQAPIRANTGAKAVLVIAADFAWTCPTGLVPKLTLSELAPIDLREYSVIAALHPSLQVLNCVWRN